MSACLFYVYSGSLDEDETIGPNKPFKDIAYGLASCGISVLRYPKRNFQYPPFPPSPSASPSLSLSFFSLTSPLFNHDWINYSKTLTPEETNSFTLVEECVEDPVAAISSAANHPSILFLSLSLSPSPSPSPSLSFSFSLSPSPFLFQVDIDFVVEIDKEKIFVLGHSLGGFACPLIAQRAGNSLRGIISLAGNTRRM